MTDKEALLEALEALHYCEALNRDVDERKMQAITVIRKLWTEHAMREVQRLGQEIEQKIGCVNHDCDQCKAQRTEQEPVAFASHGVINWIADKQFQHEADLYTSPPQRTWVNPQDEEIKILWIQYRAALPRYLCFAKALLARAMEKNT